MGIKSMYMFSVHLLLSVEGGLKNQSVAYQVSLDLTSGILGQRNAQLRLHPG